MLTSVIRSRTLGRDVNVVVLYPAVELCTVVLRILRDYYYRLTALNSSLDSEMVLRTLEDLTFDRNRRLVGRGVLRIVTLYLMLLVGLNGSGLVLFLELADLGNAERRLLISGGAAR